jgi:hypothetical protein
MTKVYGASDDLIEIEGSIKDEIGCYDEIVTIKFSDGTKATIKYCKEHNNEIIGVWEIKVIEKGTSFIELQECFDEDAEIYSDVLVLDDKVRFYKHTKQIMR